LYQTQLELAGVSERPGVVVADAGYRHKRQIEEIVANGTRTPRTQTSKRNHVSAGRLTLRPHAPRAETEHGHAIHQQQTAEPVFGHTKHNRRIDRLQRRDRAAALYEWRLIAATHSLASSTPTRWQQPPADLHDHTRPDSYRCPRASASATRDDFPRQPWARLSDKRVGEKLGTLAATAVRASASRGVEQSASRASVGILDPTLRRV
jgi:hypothetical protein